MQFKLKIERFKLSLGALYNRFPSAYFALVANFWRCGATLCVIRHEPAAIPAQYQSEWLAGLCG